ncbi:GTPase ObgE [Candidatus Saccharibacteria bacterium]|jgi:obg family GTPase cgtA|nr:GTPase ObgE [Candidatus Saccharibacteria bacterium]MBB1531979.1 GTPase ObgE [Candidatus Saccharibacteria bacterium]
MFCDTAKVSLKAGKGGDGAVSFRREIYINKGGPDGGNGGKGGSIIFVADKDTNTLIDFRFNPILTAEDGGNGSGTRSAGRSGKNLIVEVPIGTVVKRDGKIIADLTHDRQEAVIAKGGDGGFGNAHFKSSVRQTPIIAEVGEPGEEFEAELELKLLADVGLVGLPNAGKSTFLSIVSNAKPEIADYPFTTLTPNLGVATIDRHDILIADIPGLIEGAAEGRGLGHAFLRHVDRTAVLLHLVDVYNNDAGEAYRIIRNELDKYSDLKDRPEIVALTKCEGVDNEIIEMQSQAIREVNPNAYIYNISAVSRKGVEELLRALWQDIKIAKEKKQEQVNSTADIILEKDANTKHQITQDGIKGVPVISLSSHELKNTWTVTRGDDGVFHVTGEKIEKFARRTDMGNYASVNRLRDILKKLGIRAELTNQGATQDSIIEISGKTFTLVEQY